MRRKLLVQVEKLEPISDRLFPKVMLTGRRVGKIGIVDSAIHQTFNKHWLVKHATKVVAGIPVSNYAIYAESELAIYEGDYNKTTLKASQPKITSEVTEEINYFGE